MKKKLLVIGIVIIFILAIIYIKPDIKPSVGMEKIKDLSMVTSRDVGDNERFFIFRNKLVCWNGGDLTIENEDEDGKTGKATLNLNIEDPIIRPGEDYLYIANKENGLIYFVDEKAEMVERVELARGLFNIDIDNKHLIYHAKDGNGETIGIINNEGQNIMKYDFKDEQVLTYELNDSGKKCMIASLEISEEEMGSRLYIYDDLKEGEDIFFDEEIILDMQVIQFNNTMLLTDKKLYYLSGTEIVWEIQVDLLKDYKIIGKEAYLMSGNKLEIIDTKGEVKEGVVFEGNYSKFIRDKKGFFNERYIFYNQEGLSIYDGDEILNKEIPIKEIFILGEEILILDDTKLGEYEITEVEIEKENED